MIKCEVKIKAI